MQRTRTFLTNTILPVLLGGLIYITFSPKSLVLFRWIEKLNLSKHVDTLRHQFSGLIIPSWFKYNLPDLLWVFSFTSMILLVWNKEILSENMIYILTPFFLGAISEIGQLYNWVPGTFDFLDIVFYLLGALLSVIFLTNLKPSNE